MKVTLDTKESSWVLWQYQPTLIYWKEVWAKVYMSGPERWWSLRDQIEVKQKPDGADVQIAGHNHVKERKTHRTT